MSNINSDFALHAVRGRVDCTQEELAERSALSVRAIRDIERGSVSMPRRRTLELLAEGLGLGADETRRFIDHHRGRDEVSAGEAFSVQLPVARGPFTGREGDVVRLDACLFDDAQRLLAQPPMIVVSGIGGVGKTTLVTRWLSRLRTLYPDGQILINLQGYGDLPPLDLQSALTQVLSGLGVPLPDIAAGASERIEQYHCVLGERRLALVLDNAHDAEVVESLRLRRPGNLTVVTGRSTFARSSDQTVIVPLRPLSAAGAGAALRELISGDRAEAEPQAAAAIVEACGRSPVALRVVGEMIRLRPEASLAVIADELADQATRLDRLSGAEGAAGSAVRAAFASSYATLPTESAQMFRLLAAMPCEEVDTRTAAAIAGVDFDGAARTLDLLVDAQMIEVDHRDRYTMHDLLRVYGAECARSPERAAETDSAFARLMEYYVVATQRALEFVRPMKWRLAHDAPSAWAPDFDVAGEALDWLDRERRDLVACGCQAVTSGPQELGWRLAERLKDYFQVRGHMSEIIGLLTVALEAAVEAEEHAARAVLANALGISLSILGDHAGGAASFRTAVDASQTIDLPAVHAGALMNLATLYRLEGRNSAAADALELALPLARRSGEEGVVATSLCNLCFLSFSRGEFRVAFERGEEALRLSRQIGHPIEVNALQALSEVCTAVGDGARARQFATESLTIAQSRGDRAAEGTSLCHLSMLSHYEGDDAAALASALSAEECARLAGSEIDIGLSLNRVGDALRGLGRFTEAAVQHAEAARIGVSLGNQHLESEALVGLAWNSLLTNEVGRASAYAAQAAWLASAAESVPHRIEALIVSIQVAESEGRWADAQASCADVEDLRARTGYSLRGFARE